MSVPACKRRTSNIQRQPWNLEPACVPLSLLDRLNAAHKNTDRFVGLLHWRVRQPGPQQGHILDQKQPAIRLAQLLEADLQFVREVRCRR